MAGMIVLDASVMIAILDAEDAHFSRALSLLRSPGARFLAHRLTLAETLVSAVRHARGPEVAVALSELEIHAIDEIDDPLSLAELRANTGLRMPDAYVLHAAIRARARLATFDERLAATARGVGVIVVP